MTCSPMSVVTPSASAVPGNHWYREGHVDVGLGCVLDEGQPDLRDLCAGLQVDDHDDPLADVRRDTERERRARQPLVQPGVGHIADLVPVAVGRDELVDPHDVGRVRRVLRILGIGSGETGHEPVTVGGSQQPVRQDHRGRETLVHGQGGPRLQGRRRRLRPPWRDLHRPGVPRQRWPREHHSDRYHGHRHSAGHPGTDPSHHTSTCARVPMLAPPPGSVATVR